MSGRFHQFKPGILHLLTFALLAQEVEQTAVTTYAVTVRSKVQILYRALLCFFIEHKRACDT